MKLIIGLGNPGVEYEKTRHNIGFLFLDFLKEKLNLVGDFKNEIKFKSQIFEINIKNEKTFLIKPQTYMNLSGEAVMKIMNFYKINKEDIIVIFDDISLDFSKIRFRNSGSSGGQNGVKDIIKYLGEDFKRIKIGVGENKNYDLSDWVLSKFTNQELETLDNKIFEEVYLMLEKEF